MASRRTPMGSPPSRRSPRLCAAALVASASALTAVAIGPSGVAATQPATSSPPIGTVSVFARIPSPGHPFGIAVGDDRVFVSTSDGDFFAPHANSNGEAVFTYDLAGRLLHTTHVATLPAATMGLNGVALDGDAVPNRHLFVADMNGRVLRLSIDDPSAPPTVFAQAPFPFSYGNWGATMWNDITFDSAGNLYMTDDKPRIWRITPDGQASIWFQDPRLLGLFGFAGGGLGGRIDPTGKYFYFADTVSQAYDGAAVVYRLPLVDAPTASDLQVVHRFPLRPGEIAGQTSPDATGIAFAKSGDLYVALTGRNQIAVLSPSGKLIRTISDPRFDAPWGLAFKGDSLLVTNAEIRPAEDAASWLVFNVCVGEPGLPLNHPTTPTAIPSR